MYLVRYINRIQSNLTKTNGNSKLMKYKLEGVLSYSNNKHNIDTFTGLRDCDVLIAFCYGKQCKIYCEIAMLTPSLTREIFERNVQLQISLLFKEFQKVWRGEVTKYENIRHLAYKLHVKCTTRDQKYVQTSCVMSLSSIL